MKYILQFIFGIIFLLIVTPVGWVLRLMGVDYMEKRPRSGMSSYWKDHRS